MLPVALVAIQPRFFSSHFLISLGILFLHVKNAAGGRATSSIFHITYFLLSDLSRSRHQQKAKANSSNILVASINILLNILDNHLIHQDFTPEQLRQHWTDTPLDSDLRTLNIPRKHFREQLRVLNSDMDHARSIHSNDSFHKSTLFFSPLNCSLHLYDQITVRSMP
jgi:hypothetical protein